MVIIIGRGMASRDGLLIHFNCRYLAEYFKNPTMCIITHCNVTIEKYLE